MKTKILAAGAAIVVSVLVATACSSSDSGDSQPDITAAAVPASVPEAVTAALGTETTSTTPTAAPTSTTASASTASDAPTTASASTTSTTPTTGPTTSASTTSTTASSVPAETSEPAASTSTTSAPAEASQPPASTTSTTIAPPPATTAPVVADLSPAELRVQVLNGSGIAGAAGRLSARLRDAGYDVLPAGNAARRYATSAVYYAEGWQDEAEEILRTADISEIEEVTAMPQIFASEEIAVLVLLGTDSAPAIAAEQAELRPRPDFDVKLPLGDDVPSDRFVPGLADIQIYTQQNDEDPEVFLYIDTLARALGSLGTFANENLSPVSPDAIEARTTEKYEAAIEAVEANLEWLGFTPQNVCGAPEGYSFRDLLQPTREWNEGTKTYQGDAIFTTDRLIELHGGERINPEENLEFYIREAVQTSYDSLRLFELSAETETPQMILCDAWKMPEGKIPESANAYWYALLTPGIQPRETLLSQGTYHVKEISRNGNFAYVLICHPTLGSHYVDLTWREAGYRAEAVGSLLDIGCQANFERRGYVGDHEPEDTIRFGFGDRSFSVSDLQEFPRG